MMSPYGRVFKTLYLIKQKRALKHAISHRLPLKLRNQGFHFLFVFSRVFFFRRLKFQTPGTATAEDLRPYSSSDFDLLPDLDESKFPVVCEAVPAGFSLNHTDLTLDGVDPLFECSPKIVGRQRYHSRSFTRRPQYSVLKRNHLKPISRQGK